MSKASMIGMAGLAMSAAMALNYGPQGPTIDLDSSADIERRKNAQVGVLEPPHTMLAPIKVQSVAIHNGANLNDYMVQLREEMDQIDSKETKTDRDLNTLAALLGQLAEASVIHSQIEIIEYDNRVNGIIAATRMYNTHEIGRRLDLAALRALRGRAKTEREWNIIDYQIKRRTFSRDTNLIIPNGRFIAGPKSREAMRRRKQMERLEAKRAGEALLV